MSGNYSTLERNVLDSLSETGQAAFMWARSLPELAGDLCAYQAEQFAREAERLEAFYRFALAAAAKHHAVTEAQLSDLMDFLLARHAFHAFPGRQTAYTTRRREMTR